MSTRFLIQGKPCNRRREEISMVRDFLLLNGWHEAGQVGEADLVVFFACAGVRYIVDESVREIAALLGRMKPGAELVVGSCLPEIDKASLRRVFAGRTITPTDFTALDDLPHVRHRIGEMARLWGPDAACPPLPRPRLAASARMRLDTLAFEGLRRLLAVRRSPRLRRAAVHLKRRSTVGFSIAAGCQRRCAYCARPLASGKVRSKPIDVVIETIRRGLRLGYGGFDLCADSIGGYGTDLGVTLGDLLERVLAVGGRFSVGLYDVHPQDFIRFFDQIERLCEAGKLHHLYVGIQSGNEKILRRMRRPCDVADLAAKLAAIRRHEHVFMQSGIVAGFPGETDREFEDTLRLLERVGFDDVYVHCYCDMPGTEAAGFLPKVGREALRRRLAAIQRAGIRHDAAVTLHEWEANLAVPGASGAEAEGGRAGFPASLLPDGRR
jgi:tRNA A37 methylthiotransferase MiaB